MDQQLLSFVTVVELGNFTRAAEILHTTQPAVSQHIQSLERRLNTKLLERTNKFVRLNRAGEVVYHHAKEILNLYNQMERLVVDLTSHCAGPLRIGSSYTFGEYVLPHVIARFRRQYERVTPVVTIANTQHVVKMVADGELDIGIIEGHASDTSVTIQPFAEDTMVVVVSAAHALVQGDAVTSTRLADETWIVREEGSGTREYEDLFLSDAGIQPDTMMEFGSTQVIKESVEAGLGISLLSKCVLRKELAQGRLSILSVQGAPVTRQFSIVTYPSTFQTNATMRFRQFLVEQSADLVR